MRPAAAAGDEFELHRGRSARPEDHDQPDGQEDEPYPAPAAPGRPSGPRTAATWFFGVGWFLANRPVPDLPPPRPARARLLLFQAELTWRCCRDWRAASSAPSVQVTPGTGSAVPRAALWRAQRISAPARSSATGASCGPVVFGSPGGTRRDREPGRTGTGFRAGPRRPGGGVRPGAHLCRAFRPGPRPELGIGARAKPAPLPWA
jgi:hypothetical protein